MIEENYSLALWDSSQGVPRKTTNANAPAIHDKAVAHVYGKDSSLLPPLGNRLESFGNWPSVASTIYNKLYQITRFDPSSTKYNEALSASLRYSFETCPFWNAQLNFETHVLPIQHGQYQSVTNAITDFCEQSQIDSAIGKRMSWSFGQALSLAFEQEWLEQKRSLLQNATIAITQRVVRVTLLYGVVAIEMDPEGKKYRLPDQDIQMVLGQGALNYNYCNRHANNIVAFDRVDSTKWEALAGAHGQPAADCGGIT